MTQEQIYNSSLSPALLSRQECLNPAELRLLTYSKPHDECEGLTLHLANMEGGFPFTALGREWKAVEFLYLCGEWSTASEESLAIQEDVLTAKSGYAAKIFKKTKHKRQIRPDFPQFRHQWMLWCVWQKCLGNADFRTHLLSLPTDRIIVEIARRDPVWATWPDADGILHGGNAMGKVLTLCKRCLAEGTAPEIDTALLNSAGIYILGQRVTL